MQIAPKPCQDVQRTKLEFQPAAGHGGLFAYACTQKNNKQAAKDLFRQIKENALFPKNRHHLEVSIAGADQRDHRLSSNIGV